MLFRISFSSLLPARLSRACFRLFLSPLFAFIFDTLMLSPLIAAVFAIIFADRHYADFQFSPLMAISSPAAGCTLASSSQIFRHR
jgi:threonine/homoserine efflux transporter RhtA